MCDHPGCNVRILKGTNSMCGGTGCNKYFCDDHLI